jgi:hypothetical protein
MQILSTTLLLSTIPLTIPPESIRKKAIIDAVKKSIVYLFKLLKFLSFLNVSKKPSFAKEYKTTKYIGKTPNKITIAPIMLKICI